MNIYEKMSAITNEICTVGKNLTVGKGENKYNAVSEGDVLRAVKTLEAKHGVYSFPASRKVIWQETMDFTTSYGSEKTNICMRIETVYRFVNIEKPDEFIEIVSFGDGIDTQDKSCGKAMTYSDKYALLKAYKIETGDDPDQNASETIVKPQTRKTANPSIPQQAKPTAEEVGDLYTIASQYIFKSGKNAGKKMCEIDENTLKYFMTVDNQTMAKYAKAVWEHDFKDITNELKGEDTPPLNDEDLPF